METKKITCQTLVIGAGSAGIEAYKNAIASGRDCIIVDSGPLGTTAQRSGELPVSLLMSAGIAMRSIENLPDSGVLFTQKVQADTTNVLSSLRAVRTRATSEVLSFMYRIPENRRVRGQAHFVDPHKVMVDDNLEITFETAIIATGSSPLVTYEQSRLKNILTTNDFFELDKLPDSVAIFGSSKVGLELGQALSYLGVNTVVFGQRKLWSLTDDTVLTVAHQLLSSRFNLYVDTFITSMENESDGTGYAIYYIDDRSYENYLHMESVVAATDRIPNVAGMNLQKIGVKLTHTGCVKVDENTLQTSIPHIFAAGDVCHEQYLTSVAIREGKYAGLNAVSYPELQHKPKQVPVDIVYTDPVLAIVGNSLDKMRE
ncbi:MAG: FAD-dependent oxidoreductase, partial [Succinivibrio sp.]